jgi:hypothetical protein
MATKNPFDQITIRPGDVQRSQKWYQNQVRNLTNAHGQINRVLKRGEYDLDQQVMPGGLYLFKYDPKHKDTLPYYDVMPLVFPFAKMPDGFLALNLHYLPHALRFKLMGALLQLAMSMTDKQRQARMSWQLLNQASKYPGVNACVKHYLLAHVQTRFMNIHPDQWLAASMMPLEKFVGATSNQVYKDSRRKV